MDSTELTTTENGSLFRRPWNTRLRGLCWASEAHRAPAQISGPWFCSCWPEVPFLSCSFSIGSTYRAVPPVIHRWWPGHLHTGFPRDILYETPGRGWWTAMNSRGLKQELWWITTLPPKSSLRLQPTHTLFLAFPYMLCMSRTNHSSTPSLWRAHKVACLGTQSNDFFRSTKVMYSLLLTALNFSCNCCTMNTALVVLRPSINQTACRCALVIVESSRLPSL